MAKSPLRKYLCIAETDSRGVSTKWRMFAQYIDTIPDLKAFFKELSGSPQYLKASTPAVRYGVKVLEFSSDRLTPSGEIDVRETEPGLAIEVLEPVQFKNTVIEDADKVRATLKNGFTLTESAYRALKSGGLQIAVVVPSRSGHTKALLFTESSKLQEKSSTGRSVTVAITNTPANGLHSMDAIPIVQLDDINRLEYHGQDSTLVRSFLESAPVFTDNPFTPYSFRDYAPLFFNRTLSQAKSTQTLGDGRSLTKNDIRIIVGIVEDALKNESQVSETLQISNSHAVKEVIAGIKGMLPKITEQMSQDDPIANGVRTLMMNDEAIRTKLISMAKTQWLAEKSAEQSGMERQLDVLRKQLAGAEREKAALETTHNKLEKKLSTLQEECKKKESEIAAVGSKLQDAVAQYRHDFAALAQTTGLTSMCLPYIIQSKPINNILPAQSALSANFTAFLDQAHAQALSEYVQLLMKEGFALAVNASYAHAFADAISVAQCGQTAGVVVRADEGVPFAELKRAIDGVQGDVVLVEGVFASVRDFTTLSLVRYCKDKILVFSIDEPLNLAEASQSLFQRIFVIDNLPVTKFKAVPMYQLKTPMVVCTNNVQSASIPKFPSNLLANLIKTQQDKAGEAK